jgi:hypothetical protein
MTDAVSVGGHRPKNLSCDLRDLRFTRNRGRFLEPEMPHADVGAKSMAGEVAGTNWTVSYHR